MQISQKEKKWHQQEKMKKAGEVLGPITIFANDLKFAKIEKLHKRDEIALNMESDT